ncbi:MAG: hypothetical protein QM809_16580 [Gordonia sp. (in: high G+C Gram-positive bacteria)]|uniref:hypothetical protein n=1 Tax=Gordonia sp. (in: high G+C Gram-positive bacteria) TaxID=84139 RepID=UPI0039E71351
MTTHRESATRAVMSMQDIADLARVQRPVVSMWRTRYADGENPFPSPIRPGGTEFDAEVVARWLAATGRGKNPEAADDVALYTTLLRDTARSMDSASLLALLSARSGGGVADLDAPRAFEVAAGLADGHLVSLDAVESVLGEHSVIDAVDRLVEAAYDPARVITRLADLGCMDDPAGAAELLTDDGTRLTGAIAAELVRSSRSPVAPSGPGGLVLLDGAMGLLAENELAELACTPNTRRRPWQRARWRALLAAGVSVRQVAAGDPVLHDATILAQWASATSADAAAFFDWIDDIVVSLGPGGRAAVIGPAELLVDDLLEEVRRRRGVVLGEHDYFAPLRYVARLPKGLVRSAGRRQLALWVIAPSTDEQSAATVFADHSALSGPVEIQALAADVAVAAAGEWDRRSHLFLRGTVRASRVTIPAHVLRISADDEIEADGGDLLAQIWDAESSCGVEVLAGIRVQAEHDDAAVGAISEGTVSWSAVTSGHGRPLRVIAGVRIPDELVGAAGGGRVVVLGDVELRDPARIGARGVDRLALERVAPRSTFTEPGDVVYLRTGRPAALVDDVGGRLVLAPARIARCRDVDLDGRRLVPHIVAADIVGQRSAHDDAWRLRTVPARQVEVVVEAHRRIERRRAALRAELAVLGDLDDSLIRGLTTGVLTAEFISGTNDSAQQKENSTWRK